MAGLVQRASHTSVLEGPAGLTADPTFHTSSSEPLAPNLGCGHRRGPCLPCPCLLCQLRPCHLALFCLFPLVSFETLECAWNSLLLSRGLCPSDSSLTFRVWHAHDLLRQAFAILCVVCPWKTTPAQSFLLPAPAPSFPPQYSVKYRCTCMLCSTHSPLC